MMRTETHWYSMAVDEVLKRLGTRAEGLTTPEVRQRLAEFGPNRLKAAPRRGFLRIFLRQFHNVLIYVLLAASGVTAILHHWADTRGHTGRGGC